MSKVWLGLMSLVIGKTGGKACYDEFDKTGGRTGELVQWLQMLRQWR
jgi:hypothetical protein